MEMEIIGLGARERTGVVDGKHLYILTQRILNNRR